MSKLPAAGAGTPSLAMPATLEDLLALRPPQAQPWTAPAQEPRPVQDGASPIAPDTSLLFLHAAPPDSLAAQAWVQRLLEGARLQLAHLQEPDALEQIQGHQPQAVLIHFAPGTLPAATALAARLQITHPQLPRVAVGQARDAESMLAALRAGVQDFLDIDSPIDTSQQVMRDLLARAQRLPALPQHAPAPQTAIISARAGLGCSVLAAHLAWYLQQCLAGARHGGAAAPAGDAEALDCLLIELGSPGGDCAIYLNTPGEFSFSDAVAQQRRLDQRMAQTALARHESGLRLLPQPRQVQAQAYRDARALLKRLDQYFSHIVLDLGSDTPPQLMAEILPAASEIWVLCDQNVVSVVWTMELLHQIESLQIERERLRLIVNRHDSHLALDAEQVARQLQLPLLATLPERRRELADAVNHGKLLSPRQKGDPYVQALDKLIALLLKEHHPGAAQHHATPTGLLAPLLQRIRRS